MPAETHKIIITFLPTYQPVNLKNLILSAIETFRLKTFITPNLQAGRKDCYLAYNKRSHLPRIII